jgi:anti-sigma regulatory factor (Ser/Thr protein kinase)
VNEAFGEFAHNHGLPDGVRRSVNVALDELLANDISYGMAGRENGSLMVEVELDQERITVTITDNGPEFDPFRQASPDTTLSVEDRPIGGLGIFLVQKLMDEVAYERRDGNNVVKLVKRLDV